MVYEINEKRFVKSGVLIEMDNNDHMHIYVKKRGKLEYIKCLDVSSNISYDDFIIRCEKWINENL